MRRRGLPTRFRCQVLLYDRGIQLIVATRSLLAYRATRRPTPRCLTVTLDEFISIAGYHRKHVIWRRCFRRCWWPTNLDKHSTVLGLVQDEPALRAGAASGILDKTCARRSAGGRSAPRNGLLSLTKECNLDLGSGEATSEAMVTSHTVSSGRRLTWPILAIGQAPLPAFAKQASFGALC